MNSQQKYESSSPTGTLSAHSIRTYINFHKRLGTSSAPLRPLISGKKKFKMAAALSFPKFANLWTNQLRCFHLSALLSQIRIIKRPLCTVNDYNPILNQEALPRFNKILPSHVAPAIAILCRQFESDFVEFERKLKGKAKLRRKLKFRLGQGCFFLSWP